MDACMLSSYVLLQVLTRELEAVTSQAEHTAASLQQAHEQHVGLTADKQQLEQQMQQMQAKLRQATPALVQRAMHLARLRVLRGMKRHLQKQLMQQRAQCQVRCQRLRAASRT
jgi:hypothetical protein